MSERAPIFVDTNVFMYAVGGEHPLRRKARDELFRAVENGKWTARDPRSLGSGAFSMRKDD